MMRIALCALILAAKLGLVVGAVGLGVEVHPDVVMIACLLNTWAVVELANRDSSPIR